MDVKPQESPSSFPPLRPTRRYCIGKLRDLPPDWPEKTFPLLRFSLSPLLAGRLRSTHTFYTLQTGSRLLLVLENSSGQTISVLPDSPVGFVTRATTTEVMEARERLAVSPTKENSVTSTKETREELLLEGDQVDVGDGQGGRGTSSSSKRRKSGESQVAEPPTESMNSTKRQRRQGTFNPKDPRLNGNAARKGASPEIHVISSSSGEEEGDPSAAVAGLDSSTPEAVPAASTTSDASTVPSSSSTGTIDMNSLVKSLQKNDSFFGRLVPAHEKMINTSGGSFMRPAAAKDASKAFCRGGILCLDVETISDGAYTQFTQIGAVLYRRGEVFNYYAEVAETVGIAYFYQCCGSGMFIPDPHFVLPGSA
jgi:hypothetical protein